MSAKKKIKELELMAQYKVLSELEEMWGVKPSKHRAYLLIQKKMRNILRELQKVNSKTWECSEI